jgi:hypothetical protein
MVGAHEGWGIAEVSPADTVAAVAAHIQEGVDFALYVTCEKNGVFCHPGRHKIIRFTYLAFMPQKEPASAKYLLQLLLINVAVNENAPVK